MTYSEIHGYCDFHKFYEKIFDQLPDRAVVAEVGVWLGHSVAFMASLSKESGKAITIYACDTFEGSLEHKKLGVGNFQKTFEKNMIDCGVSDLVKVIPSESVVAARGLKDGSLDFVFLDGSHDYHNVTADIRAWRSKVKPSGILAGHDYCESWPGVIRAVNEQFKFKKKINVERNVWWVENSH